MNNIDAEHVKFNPAKDSMETYEISEELVLRGMNHPSGRKDDLFIEDGVTFCAVVDKGLPIEISCVTTQDEEWWTVMNVCRVQN